MQWDNTGIRSLISTISSGGGSGSLSYSKTNFQKTFSQVENAHRHLLRSRSVSKSESIFAVSNKRLRFQH